MKNVLISPLTAHRSPLVSLIIAMLLTTFSLSGGLRAQTFCTLPVTASIGSASMSALFPGGGSWPAGSTIGVSGQLTVDQSATFNNLRFIMGAGASIKVQGSGVVLTANNGTVFDPCEFAFPLTMWTGILIQNGGALAFSNVTLNDAWIGLRFMGGANAAGTSLLNCSLYNNMNGIMILSFPLFRPAVFAGNTIMRLGGTSIYLPPPGQSYSGSQLHRGIWVISSTADLATGATQRNVIEGYRYGMWDHYSTVTIANADFKNQVDDITLADTLDGTDIYALRTNLNVGGSGTGNCYFLGADNSSIISKETRGLSVSGAFFENPSKYGIRAVQSIALSVPIRITKNVFKMNSHNTYSAIYVERPPSGPDLFNVWIQENQIKREALYNATKHAAVMIDVQGKVNAIDKVLIDNNPIENTSSAYRISGIRIVGKGNFYNITNNDKLEWISPNNPDAWTTSISKGIIAKDLVGSSHIIQYNEVFGRMGSNKSFLQAGIYLENCPVSLFVCDNIIDKASNNIECRSALTGTILRRNEMKQAFRGLYCSATAVMDNQIRHENTWTGAYTIIGAKHESAAPSFIFRYDLSNMQVVNDDPPTWAPPLWFGDEGGSRNGECTPGGEAGPFSPKERDLLDGTLLPDATAPNWDLRHDLLYKLLRRPELAAAYPEAATYLNSNASAVTSPWQFANAEHLFDNAYTLPAGQQTQTASITAQYRDYAAQLSVLDEQMAQMPGGYDPTLAQQRAQKFLDLAAVADNLEQQRTTAAPTIAQSLQNVLGYAQSLPESTVYEGNLKDILVLAIRHAQGDSLIEADFATLRAIAAQCPTTGGQSVRRAPQWLMHEEFMEYADKDWDDCGQARPKGKGRSEVAVSSSEVKVFPNPTNDKVQITFPEGKGNWTISNMLGRVIRQGSATEQSMLLAVGDWQSGVYFLTWRAVDGSSTTVKFIVSL